MHAYIFEGENTVSVREKGMAFAKGLNCSAPILNQDPTPCGVCLSCRTFESGNHPDTFHINGTKQSGIGVEDIRTQVILPMAYKPFMYKHKVFIVDKAETLTPAAQNALLKTIEEPAPYGVFLFFAANTHNFLPTMLSRCAVKKIRERGDAVSDKTLEDMANELSDTLSDMDLYDAFMQYRKVEPLLDKEALRYLLDLMYASFGAKITGAVNNKQEPKKVWFESTSAITRTKQVLAQNGNTQLALELMFSKMCNEER